MRNPMAAVVGINETSTDFLHRRVGGILKGIAEVRPCTFQKLDKLKADIVICRAFGACVGDIKKKFENSKTKVVEVDLILLPVAVRTLTSLDKSLTLGVVANHHRCANYLLSEIIRSGVLDHKFMAGAFEDMPQMPVDKFIISEEMSDAVNVSRLKQEAIFVPRTISSNSAAELINAVMTIPLSS